MANEKTCYIFHGSYKDRSKARRKNARISGARILRRRMADDSLRFIVATRAKGLGAISRARDQFENKAAAWRHVARETDLKPEDVTPAHTDNYFVWIIKEKTKD